jgi:hypothetical protein
MGRAGSALSLVRRHHRHGPLPVNVVQLPRQTRASSRPTRLRDIGRLADLAWPAGQPGISSIVRDARQLTNTVSARARLDPLRYSSPIVTKGSTLPLTYQGPQESTVPPQSETPRTASSQNTLPQSHL